MHVIIGLAGLGLLIAYILQLGHAAGFSGVVHPPSLLLLGLAPFFMAMVAYRFTDLFNAVKAVAEALRFDAARSRLRLYEELTQFAAELRARRPARALEVADASSHALLRQLGPLVVRQYSAEELESTASTALYCLVSERKRSEDVLGTLGRVAPATGLVGTVLGLINLLKDLARFDQLGPSMALALLCTLYGLLLANAVYQPLARVIHSQTASRVEEAKLLTRALVLTVQDKPLSDVRRLFELAGAPQAAAAPVSPDVSVGGSR
ncbi:hypothetical protein FGE12_06755 [Aggregicoccus sp. 17bor-14]|uniref:MotA/TolQ/ExbB proton channel family protein n=1 Tax=Myxococcaceae TaxID=31 RepID=UPI00129D0C94|nr:MULTISPECIES: MotA/TolQ/ExbB proton channel family protein [Myxococcaceae]MBF5042088.1 MotA/TolQ/ExbB proton channel family protein [Simulacricoccus sp. 17bor-14]MRI87867.1 hypothetical protein [Aggregicoccus sp. 17bor-14]